MSPTKVPEKPKRDVHADRAVDAMRRATEQATKGPPEMRSGRFNPQPKRAAE